MCVPGNMCARIMGECLFNPLRYRNKKAGLGLAADAAEDPLPFNVATAVVLCFAKLGLVNLKSHTWSAYLSAYLPRMMIHDSVGTNLSAIATPTYHRFC